MKEKFQGRVPKKQPVKVWSFAKPGGVCEGGKIYLLNKCLFFFRNIQKQSLTSETYFRLGLGVLHVYIVQDQTLGRFGRS